jgi:hypothetical protein
MHTDSKPLPHHSTPIPRSSSSLVHTKSTSAPDSIPHSYREYVLHRHTDEYKAVLETYDSLFQIKKAQRLEKCRSNGYFLRNKETGQVKVSSTSCHVRGCPMCSAAKAARVSQATAEYIGNETFRFTIEGANRIF